MNYTFNFFYTNGFVILDNVLESETLNKLKKDLLNVQRCKTKDEIFTALKNKKA
jgi:hypothetical protein